MKTLLLITDAWEPQVNGVVRTLQTTIAYLKKNHNLDVLVIHPYMFTHHRFSEFAFPINTKPYLATMIVNRLVDHVHIAVEGPLGLTARNICVKYGIKFTTAYHTRFPEYLKARYGVPLSLSYSFFRWFHKHSSRILAPTQSIVQDLEQQKFNNVVWWSRGVDTELFNPKHREPYRNFEYALYVGRVSKEKNIEAFLEASTSLTKIVVGDGPERQSLEKRYPDVEFLGTVVGQDLAKIYANAAVFVFPSKTDTFGLVNVEALASGTPVAGFPVGNMKDIVTNDVGCLNEDLSVAIETALVCSRDTCRQYAVENFSWEKCTAQFANSLVPAFR